MLVAVVLVDFSSKRERADWSLGFCLNILSRGGDRMPNVNASRATKRDVVVEVKPEAVTGTVSDDTDLSLEVELFSPFAAFDEDFFFPILDWVRRFY